MTDWIYAQTDKHEQLARLHQFSYTKHQASGPVEFVITVKEFATPETGDMQFFAQADKETNQNSVPFRPCGWHKTLLGALSSCIANIQRFDFHG